MPTLLQYNGNNVYTLNNERDAWDEKFDPPIMPSFWMEGGDIVAYVYPVDHTINIELSSADDVENVVNSLSAPVSFFEAPSKEFPVIPFSEGNVEQKNEDETDYVLRGDECSVMIGNIIIEFTKDGDGLSVFVWDENRKKCFGGISASPEDLMTEHDEEWLRP